MAVRDLIISKEFKNFRLIVHREEEARQILKGKLSMRQSDIRYTLISCIPVCHCSIRD